MRRVVLESPFAGEIDRNVAYARRCVLDCLNRGEAPIASHLLFTQPGILKDEIPGDRELGIEAGLTWVQVADLMAVYTDHGISDGMENAMSRARLHKIPIEFRQLGDAADSLIREASGE